MESADSDVERRSPKIEIQLPGAAWPGDRKLAELTIPEMTAGAAGSAEAIPVIGALPVRRCPLAVVNAQTVIFTTEAALGIQVAIQPSAVDVKLSGASASSKVADTPPAIIGFPQSSATVTISGVERPTVMPNRGG